MQETHMCEEWEGGSWLALDPISYPSSSGGQCRLWRGRPVLFPEHGLISITAYWMTVIHIPFTQFNVTSIGLGYYMIFEREKFEMIDSDTFNTALHTLACI
jgi:hypothetical protein